MLDEKKKKKWEEISVGAVEKRAIFFFFLYSKGSLYAIGDFESLLIPRT